MKRTILALVTALSPLLLSSCTSGHSSGYQSSKWRAYNLALDGQFREARLAVERGQGTRSDYDSGADGYMQRTLSPELYKRWRRGNPLGADAADLEFWAERANL
jgi:hypothetical protein